MTLAVAEALSPNKPKPAIHHSMYHINYDIDISYIIQISYNYNGTDSVRPILSSWPVLSVGQMR